MDGNPHLKREASMLDAVGSFLANIFTQDNNQLDARGESSACTMATSLKLRMSLN